MAPDGSEIEVNRGLAERRTQINMLKKKRPGARPRQNEGSFQSNPENCKSKGKPPYPGKSGKYKGKPRSGNK